MVRPCTTTEKTTTPKVATENLIAHLQRRVERQRQRKAKCAAQPAPPKDMLKIERDAPS